MKIKRTCMVCGLIVAMIIVATLGMLGCQAEPAPPGQKTLKIGLVAYLGWPTGLDLLRGFEIPLEEDNAAGGIDIGGEKYKLELISYDSNNNQATEVAAVNRLVFEDKVKYIVSDGTNAAAWIKITEENKVFTLAMPGDTRVNESPDIHYSCNPTTRDTSISCAIGWFCKNYPDLAKRTLTARPDNQIGHIVTELTGNVWRQFGVEPLAEFYPSGATDLSALGTKVKTINPSAFGAEAGGTLQDAIAYKAVYQAGYRGQLFSPLGGLVSTMVQTASAEAVEGFIGPSITTEYDPPQNELARKYQDAWTAKYGEGDADTSGPTYYACLKTAFQQAGSVDVDKVAAVIFNGLRWDSAAGPCQMISRPDLGNDRTVATMATVYLKQIKDGKATLLATIELEEGLGYIETANKGLNP